MRILRPNISKSPSLKLILLILLHSLNATLLLLVVEKGEGVVRVRASLHHKAFDRTKLSAMLSKFILQDILPNLDNGDVWTLLSRLVMKTLFLWSLSSDALLWLGVLLPFCSGLLDLSSDIKYIISSRAVAPYKVSYSDNSIWFLTPNIPFFHNFSFQNTSIP